MTGIFLIVVAVLWLVIAFIAVKVIANRLPDIWWAYLLRVVLFLALLPLPLIDEIVGKRQFEQLCSENSTVQVDRDKSKGKTVYLANQPDIEIKGTWVRVVLKPWRFVDAKTGETVVSYNTLQAARRVFQVSEGGVPLTFTGYCAPVGRPASVQTFKELGINYIEPPARKGE